MDKQIFLNDIEKANDLDDFFDTYFRQQTDKNQYHNDFINSIIKILNEIYLISPKSKKQLVEKIKYKTGNFELSNNFDKNFNNTLNVSYEQILYYFNEKLLINDTPKCDHADQRVIINNIIFYLGGRILKWNTSNSNKTNLNNIKSQTTNQKNEKLETDNVIRPSPHEPESLSGIANSPNQLISGRPQSINADNSVSVVEDIKNEEGANHDYHILGTNKNFINQSTHFTQSKTLDEVTSTTNLPKDDPKVLKTKPSNSKKNENRIMIWVQGVTCFMSVFGLVGTVLIFVEIISLRSLAINNSDNIIKQLGQIYTPEIGQNKDYGYLKTQFEKLIKPEVSLAKTTEPIPAVTSESKKGTLSLDQITPTLKNNLDDLNNKIATLKKISEKVEVKLDDAKIKEIFNSIVKDENSDFGKMIKKINETESKRLVKTDEIISHKNKKDFDDLAKNKDRLDKENKGLSNKILEVNTSVSKLEDEVKNKTNEIVKLEAKIKSIGDEKIGFKGPQGYFAILLTNSKDFELTEPILSATLVIVEKQIKESGGIQKLGIYAATGNKIDTKFNLKKGIRGLKPTEMDVANARPTETIAEVGKTFLEYAFDDGKEPIIPVNERKAIIISTWAAGAPKNNDGWDNISQVDAILIQTPKANQLREGSAWLDFILKKNGRLLFVQAEEKINGGSPAIDQLQRHLSTLLNTKKD